MTVFPGAAQRDSAALQTRDRYAPAFWTILDQRCTQSASSGKCKFGAGSWGARMVFLQVIVGGLLLGAIYALFSSGLTLIWGMMNFINFAHGALTVALHILLTRSTMGSRLLAVAEDRAAAMLMGIRPDRMQMLAWGLPAGAAGIAGALMATAYPWSPSVGETFGLIAFVVVALGGFGSVLGSLYAGLIIGLIQAISAFWLGAIYKDIVVYGLFVALLWFRPQGLMGKA
jgi:branched-subunit amino acid ABC-type transport system permease component